MASTDYLLQDVKGIKESFDNATRIAIMSFAGLPVFTIEETDQFTEIFTSTENISGTRQLAEQETPDVNALQDGFSVSLVNRRYANAFEITSTDRQKFKDSSVMVDTFLIRQRDNLIRDVQNFFISNDGIHGVYNDGFTGAEFLAPDGVELFGVHSWNTAGAATWDNSATTALSQTGVDTAMAFGGDFKDGSGKPFPQTYDTIFVKLGSSAEREAKKLFAFDITPTSTNDINIYRGEFTIVSSPYITTGTNWFMMDTKRYDIPVYAGIGQMPHLTEPIKQNNEAIRQNAEGFWKIGINNQPFMMYGSTGTT